MYETPCQVWQHRKLSISIKVAELARRGGWTLHVDIKHRVTQSTQIWSHWFTITFCYFHLYSNYTVCDRHAALAIPDCWIWHAAKEKGREKRQWVWRPQMKLSSLSDLMSNTVPSNLTDIHSTTTKPAVFKIQLRAWSYTAVWEASDLNILTPSLSVSSSEAFLRNNLQLLLWINI